MHNARLCAGVDVFKSSGIITHHNPKLNHYYYYMRIKLSNYLQVSIKMNRTAFLHSRHKANARKRATHIDVRLMCCVLQRNVMAKIE